jgi:hypothetical protein
MGRAVAVTGGAVAQTGGGGMRWTRNKPTVPGWYWWKTYAVMTNQEAGTSIVFVAEDRYCSIEGDYVENLGGEWAGPLPLPEEPSTRGAVMTRKTLGERCDERYAKRRENDKPTYGETHVRAELDRLARQVRKLPTSRGRYYDNAICIKLKDVMHLIMEAKR